MKYAAAIMTLCSLILVGCVTKGDSYAVQEAGRIGTAKKEMWESYSVCQKYVWGNTQYQAFWDRTAQTADDTRKVQLVTMNETLSKKYKEALPQVAADLAKCDLQAWTSAKKVDAQYATAFANGMYEVMAVYKSAIDGKYKTYADFNKALFVAMKTKIDMINAANEVIKNRLLGQLDKEMDAKAARNAAAISVMQQNSAANNKPYVSTQPITTNCTKIGNNYNCTSY